MESIQQDIKCLWPQISGFTREQQEEMVIEFQIQEIYPQLVEILTLKDKFLDVFPADKFKITFLGGIKINEVIDMYQKADKVVSKSTIIKTAMRTKFVKSVDSVIEKLLSDNREIGSLKDHLRFTIEIIDDLDNSEQLANYALKVFKILPEHFELCQQQPIEGLFNEITGFSEATFQPINTKTGRKIEIKFNTTAGLLAKEKEHPTYKDRKKLAKLIFHQIAELTDFDSFWSEINTFTKNWIESEVEQIPYSNIQKLATSLKINQIHNNLIPFFYKYKRMLLQSREILSESQGIISSKKDAQEFEQIFMSLNPTQRKNQEIVKQKDLESQLIIQLAKDLRALVNSKRF